jgi:hypothetical protein
VEKFELLLNVLRDLQNAGILRHFILVGSWCQNFYRHLYGNPVEIPAARTLDADMLIPKRLPVSAQGNNVACFERRRLTKQGPKGAGLILGFLDGGQMVFLYRGIGKPKTLTKRYFS